MIAARFSRWWAGGALVAGMAMVSPQLAGAQTCTTNNGNNYPKICTLANTITWTLPQILQVTLTPSSAFGAVTAATVLAGNAVALGPSLAVGRNKPYTVSIRALAAAWTATGGANPAKPAGALSFGARSVGPWTPMTTTDAGVVTTATGTRPTVPRTWWYKVLLSSADWPGTYRLALRVTVSAP